MIALSAPVRAEVIRYRCNNEGILETYRVDTETHSVQLTVPGHPVHNGAAQVNGATIVLEIELENCGITSYQHSASPDQVPVESLMLDFTKITFSPSPLNVQGVPMRGGIVTFDLNTQVGGGGTR